MEVNRSNFWQKLPFLLQTISEAQFISIDLEMSGIAAKSSEHTLNPTLKQVYEDAKKAAQMYNILQVGLTCVSWMEAKGTYVTKTFNIPLALGIVIGNQASEQLASKVERHIGFSSKTISFLQNNDFKFSTVFDKGVPYLSAVESTQDDIITFIENTEAHDHISIKDCPHETKEFYKNMRTQIQNWVNERVFMEDVRPLIIRNPYGGRFHRFQKHLIHQLVGTEFPDYNAHSRDGSRCIEITPRPILELKTDRYAKEQRRQAVAKQIGFSHVWDALTGQAFARKIDKDLIVGQCPQKEIELIGELFEYEQRIKTNKPIIVGHNMLWDLCFLFNTFIGRLPDTVDEFQKMVSNKMPYIMDTKYLFTRGGHEMMPDLSLDECFTKVQGEEAPLVTSDKVYSYVKPAPHQAGYDSYMTAIVFLKKTHQLFQSKKGLEHIPAEDPADIKPNPFSIHAALTVPKHSDRTRHPFPTHPRKLTSIHISPNDSSLLDDDEGVADLYSKFKPMIPTSASMPARLEMTCENQDGDKQTGGGEKVERNAGPAKLPKWTEDEVFWKKYGNRIRVGQFGLVLYTGRKGVTM